MTSFILNVNWDAELKLDKYDANLSTQKSFSKMSTMQSEVVHTKVLTNLSIT